MDYAQYFLQAVSNVYSYEEREAFYTKLAYKLVADVDAGDITEVEANEFIQHMERLVDVDLVTYMQGVQRGPDVEFLANTLGFDGGLVGFMGDKNLSP